jgi:alkylglycerol monooxygenase
MFYLPLAFFAKPSIFMIHSHMNLLYQFWIHTEIVDSIGPLEFILNTPSHHRVHHGRNPYCIDKNYAGVFIIWDRMFGTFEAEHKDEKIAYGLVHPINSFDPVYVQTFNYEYLFKRFMSATSISEKFSVLFKGPGWVPGSPRLGNPNDLPPIVYPIKPYTKNVSSLLNIYIAVNFMFVVIAFSEYSKDFEVFYYYFLFINS